MKIENAVKILKEIGWKRKLDILQIIEAETCVKCYIDGDRANKTAVIADLGETQYWQCCSRAAFHWDAADSENGHEYYFDCRDFFRE